MDKKTVEEMLKMASRDDLIDIITKLTSCGRKPEQFVLDWCKKNNARCKNQAIGMELRNLWDTAQEIISEFNQYGGGPESDEEEAADALWKMDEIVKENDISWDIRVAIVNEMLAEFYEGNSGFDDLLIDVAESFCKEKEELRYLADALKQGSCNYYSNYAATIYKEIGDEEEFLKTKLSNLQYGSDYVQVAKYYEQHGERQKAREMIWQGLKDSKGRLDELVAYIAPVYIKEKDEDGLRRLYKRMMETEWDLNICAVAGYLYEYAKGCKDYDNQKKMLFLLLDTCDKKDLKKWYQTCKKELKKEAWESGYQTILCKVKGKDLKFFLDICMETGEKKTVLENLQKANHGYDYWDIDYNQYFSGRLLEEYPDEVLALYWRDIHRLLRVSNNKNYRLAADLLQSIKKSMIQLKRNSEWEQQFRDLKEMHKRKKNFICLLNKL